MNSTEEHIHHHLKNDWSNFPFKLDYLFYLLYKNNQNVSDTFLLRVGNDYILERYRNHEQMYTDFDHKELSINQDELCEYLKINKSEQFLTFRYATSIFTNNYDFRCQKDSRDLICFRFLDPSSYNLNLNSLLNANESPTPIVRKPIFGEFNQDFNQLLQKYNLIQDLEKALPDKKSHTEKKLKV